jgi:hypothetical protein
MPDESETEISALIEIFELYMLRDAELADMREPVVVATGVMLDAGVTSGMALGVVEGAICIASKAATAMEPTQSALELRALTGTWVMQAWTDWSERCGGARPSA